MFDYDVADIARGRRIVAVAGVELGKIPRRKPRPRIGLLRRIVKRMRRMRRRTG